MEDSKMIDILEKIKMFLKDDSLELAKELTELEIQNLEGTTAVKCKENQIYWNDWYCKMCSVLDCKDNQNCH